jgi:hypothetical protein
MAPQPMRPQSTFSLLRREKIQTTFVSVQQNARNNTLHFSKIGLVTVRVIGRMWEMAGLLSAYIFRMLRQLTIIRNRSSSMIILA